jgi:hypothetical protein
VLDLQGVASYIKIRNVVDEEIARTIGRPAHAGHIAEYVAAAIFDIQLEEMATNKAFDGRFKAGPFSGQSVNIKYKSGNDGLLNTTASFKQADHPDWYLVLAGPRVGAIGSKGLSAPWVVREVFLFRAADLITDNPEFKAIKPGTAASVRKARWERAVIYPVQVNLSLIVSDEQRQALRLFWGVDTPPGSAA